jgi:hypothetical protein
MVDPVLSLWLKFQGMKETYLYLYYPSCKLNFNLFEADIIHVSLEKNEKKLVLAFNFTFRYKDDVPSLRSSKFGDFDDRLYSVGFE